MTSIALATNIAPSPLMREPAEMEYEFDQPFILTPANMSPFGAAGTLLTTAITETVASWYRRRASAQ